MANMKIPSLSRNDIDHPPFLNMFFRIENKRPKEAVVKPTIALQKVYRCRNQKNSQYYFTKSLKHDDHRDDVLKQNPFKLPDILRENNEKRFVETQNGIKIKYKDGHTYNSRFGKNIRNRLRIPESPDRIMTVTDVDPEFFSLVEGRPVKYPFNKDIYIRDVRDCMLYRLYTGYHEDGILKVEKEFRNEEEKLNNACKNYNECIKDFERFLEEDHDNAITSMAEAKEMSDLLKSKAEELQIVTSDLGKAKREVYVLEEKCRQAKIYQDFLYAVSPLSWCKENSIRLDKSRASFSKYEVVKDSGSIMSLDSLISAFEKDSSSNAPTKLYFTEPEQLLSILDDIVMQNLNSWSNAEKLALNLQKLELALDKTKIGIQDEYKDITEQISDLELSIQEEEVKASNLKAKVLKIMDGNFHDTVASKEALKLHVCVKDLFDKLIFSHADFKTYDMMKMIEEEYESNMRQLDQEDLETMKAAEEEVFKNEKKAMQSAKLASKKLKELDKVNKKLKIALQPPKTWLDFRY